MSRQESIPVFRGEAVAKKIYPPRPRLIEMIGCNNINIKGVQVKNSPSWGIHLIGCESVFIDQLRLDSHVRPNNDGIDIESCKTVFISNSSIYSDDDAICFKSTIEGLPVENVVVTNCILRSNCAAIKFGTPSAAGFKNISVSNCTIYDCAQDAIKFMAVDGGIVEDISISNITMHNVEGPIFMRLGNMGRKVQINGFVS
jgi:polygalacturonase